MKTFFIITPLLLAACASNPQMPVEPVVEPIATPELPMPKSLEWYSQGCELWGAMEFEGVAERLVFRSPVSVCGKGV